MRSISSRPLRAGSSSQSFGAITLFAPANAAAGDRHNRHSDDRDDPYGEYAPRHAHIPTIATTTTGRATLIPIMTTPDPGATGKAIELIRMVTTWTSTGTTNGRFPQPGEAHLWARR